MRHAEHFIAFFPKKFNEFNNTGAQMLDSILSYDIQIICNHVYGMEMSIFCHIYRFFTTSLINSFKQEHQY